MKILVSVLCGFLGAAVSIVFYNVFRDYVRCRFLVVLALILLLVILCFRFSEVTANPGFQEKEDSCYMQCFNSSNDQKEIPVRNGYYIDKMAGIRCGACFLMCEKNI